MSRRWRSFGVVVASRNACVRSLLFQWQRARAGDGRRKDYSYRGRWKGVAGSVPNKAL